MERKKRGERRKSVLFVWVFFFPLLLLFFALSFLWIPQLIEFDFGVRFERFGEGDREVGVFVDVVVGGDDLNGLSWEGHALYFVSYDFY
jgi:hypothetical protein